MRSRLVGPTLLAIFAINTPGVLAGPPDVIVYGATPAGVCAAIGAAREGASVLLLEPTAHIGGVNTGGLSFSDSNQTVRAALGGLFEEWHSRIERDYVDRGITLPYKVAVKDHSPWTYEPGVAMRVTRRMLSEAGVRVLAGRPLKSADLRESRITRVTITSGETFEAGVFVDATYEGDLMAAAGVRWTIGREGKDEHGESLAGKRYSKPAIPISGYDDQGRMLPLLTTDRAGPEGEGDTLVMIYSFRLCLTRDPANRIPFPEPARYDPARFEVVRRYFAREKNPILLWDLYPLPGGKFDANNGIGKQFSMGLNGGGNGWSEADHAGRAEIAEAHKQYILEMYRFLTTDPAVPEPLRAQLAAYGLCRDEFPATDHWSPQLYVREGRRMRGMYVLTEHDILTDRSKPDSIAVSSFPIDSHDCQRIARKDGGVLNEGTIFPVREPGRRHGYASQVPYRSLLPRPGECANLLVPVALSATHVAFSAIRVEPTWMTLGHSAGIAAALAARRGIAVQDLPYPELREHLLKQRQVLDLPALPAIPPPREVPGSIDPATLPGIVLDDAMAELDGAWERSVNFKPHVGRGYRHDNRRGDGRSVATFRFTVPQTARYDLRVAYSPHPTRAANVPITVRCGDRKAEVSFDQTRPLPAGESFRSAGVFELARDREVTVSLSNVGTDGFVIVDAIQVVRRED
jgi:hypothetical protein